MISWKVIFSKYSWCCAVVVKWAMYARPSLEVDIHAGWCRGSEWGQRPSGDLSDEWGSDEWASRITRSKCWVRLIRRRSNCRVRLIRRRANCRVRLILRRFIWADRKGKVGTVALNLRFRWARPILKLIIVRCRISSVNRSIGRNSAMYMR